MNHLKRVLKLTYFHMRSRYRKTFAGFLWVIANPIINFCVQAIVFKIILKIQIDNYPTFLLSGLLPWFFISQTVTSLASCLVQSRELLLGFKLNPLTIVASQVLDNFINYLVSTLLIIFVLTGMNLIALTPIQLLLFLLNSFLLLFFVFFITSIVSICHVFYRDMQYVASFIMNLAFFVTPIFYAIDYVNPEYQWVFKFNVFYPMISLFQNSVYRFNFESWISSFGISVGLVLVFGSFLSLLMKKKMKDFYINV